MKKVVLLGHSAGATIVSAYAAIAENGVGFCQTARMAWKCLDSLAGLTPPTG